MHICLLQWPILIHNIAALPPTIIGLHMFCCPKRSHMVWYQWGYYVFLCYSVFFEFPSDFVWDFLQLRNQTLDFAGRICFFAGPPWLNSWHESPWISYRLYNGPVRYTGLRASRLISIHDSSSAMWATPEKTHRSGRPVVRRPPPPPVATSVYLGWLHFRSPCDLVGDS